MYFVLLDGTPFSWDWDVLSFWSGSEFQTPHDMETPETNKSQAKIQEKSLHLSHSQSKLVKYYKWKRDIWINLEFFQSWGYDFSYHPHIPFSFSSTPWKSIRPIFSFVPCLRLITTLSKISSILSLHYGTHFFIFFPMFLGGFLILSIKRLETPHGEKGKRTVRLPEMCNPTPFVPTSFSHPLGTANSHFRHLQKRGRCSWMTLFVLSLFFGSLLDYSVFLQLVRLIWTTALVCPNFQRGVNHLPSSLFPHLCIEELQVWAFKSSQTPK